MNNNYSKAGNNNAPDDSRSFLPGIKNYDGKSNKPNDSFRFQHKKDRFIWVPSDDILFVKSADHYVKSLVKFFNEKKWMSRHCTLKDLFTLLPRENFIRLNRFYLLNRNYFSHFDEKEQIIYLVDNISIPVPHRISPYLRHSLNTPYT